MREATDVTDSAPGRPPEGRTRANRRPGRSGSPSILSYRGPDSSSGAVTSDRPRGRDQSVSGTPSASVRNCWLRARIMIPSTSPQMDPRPQVNTVTRIWMIPMLV
jgi:hypothetical protein